ncbi:MAG: methyltransferase, partial [Bacteroidales bacterium]|nr:methyltransferase [Bacteroidales bacterium]
MPTPNFRFKQFEVYHDRCAMKVGMDGVTLGAWAELPALEDASEARILDIGTGCGLIALMLEQKYPLAQIDAIEIDSEAAAQAYENVQASPW